MGQSADQIRREIDDSRNDAASKIDQLQSQVQGTAQDVKDSVQGTAEKVVDDLKSSVDDTVESVRQNLDLRHQIEQRPLVAIGVALVSGFLLGGMTGNGNGDRYPQRTYSYQQPEPGSGGNYSGMSSQGGAMTQGIRSAVQKTGLEDTISNAAAALIGSVTDQMQSTINQNFPGFADKMKTAQTTSGDFSAKAKEAQGQTSL